MGQTFGQGNISLLHSEYIIDGVRMESTPAQMLGSICPAKTPAAQACEPIVDESVDAGAMEMTAEYGKAAEYANLTRKALAAGRPFPLAYAPSWTAMKVASCLIDSLWRKGNFRLDDLCMQVRWTASEKIGAYSALYGSIESLCSYLSSLGVPLKSCEIVPGKSNSLTLSYMLPERIDDESDEDSLPINPFSTENPRLEKERNCPCTISGDSSSWLIYIPFDTAPFSLGGSLLSQVLGKEGGRAPMVADADYFMDCYEVVRELSEDGILLSAATVGDGGLMTTLWSMTENGRGADIDLSGIVNSYDEQDRCRILFGEVPGAVIEISDIDYDYVDAELLLQDVAYYPLGHPGSGGLRIMSSRKSCLSGILQSLLNSQQAEGED